MGTSRGSVSTDGCDDHLMRNRHAYRKRTELDLNELELFDTRIDIREGLLNVSIAAISVALAVFGGRYAATSGMIYMLTPIILMTHSRLNRRRRRKLETAIAPAL